MKNNLLKRSMLAVSASLILGGSSIILSNEPEFIETTLKKVEKNLEECKQQELLTSFHKHARAIDLAVVHCLLNPQKEHYLVHVEKMEKILALFEKNLLEAIAEKTRQETDAKKKDTLVATKAILDALHKDIKQIIDALKKYNGSPAVLDLAVLAGQISDKKHRLPAPIRKWTIGEWKKRFQDLMSCSR